MAQSAVSAIRTGCQMLSEGKAEIDKFKKSVEKGVGDAKAIYNEVTGIFGWLKSLFGKQDKKPVIQAPAVVEKAAANTKAQKKVKEPELSYEEFQARAVHEICENLKVYFEAMRQLKEHCRELEEEALTTEKVADSAIDRIEMEWQMNQLSGQLKQVMIYGTPSELGLGSMYKEFLAKYDDILQEQEVARELKAKKERDDRWRLEHRKEILIAKVTYVIAVTMGFLQMIGMYFTL